MNFPLIALVGCVALTTLYLAALKVEPLARAIGFLCAVIANTFVRIEEYMDASAAYCHSACTSWFNNISDGVHWNGGAVLHRLMYFVLGGCILLGETVNTMQVLHAMFPTMSDITLPGVAEFSAAALFICCSALFGDILLHCWGKIQGEGLFHNMGKPSRWIVGSISLILLVFTILVNGYFYYFRGIYLSDKQSAQSMVVYILAGLGLEVSAVSPFALLSLVEGAGGVVVLILWVAELVCKIIGALASFPPHVLDTIGIRVAGVSVYQKFRKPVLSELPLVQFHPTNKTATALLPQNTSIVDSSSDSQTEEVVPVQTTVTEVPMINPENASIVLVGDLGTKMLPHITQKISELRATGSIRSWYYLDLSVNHVNASMDRIVDLSPTHAERQAVLLHEETEDQAYRKLLNNLADKIVETHLDAKVYPDVLIFVIDPRQLPSSVEILESIGRRLSRHSLVVVTELSNIDAQLLSVQTGLRDMVSLHAEDFLETTIITDPRSPFSTQFGLDTQHRFLAHTLTGLVLSHKHSLHNPSFVNVLHTLHRLSPFTALSFASEDVAIGNMPKPWGWVPGVKGEAGTGNFSDILSQTRSAIDRCFTQEASRTFPSLVSPDSACAILLSQPIRLDDERFSVCVRDNALHVSSHFPLATCSTVRGNGTAYPHHIGSRFLVQASCLYPLQPQSLLSQRDNKGSVKVTPLYPLTTVTTPVSRNGDSAKDQKPVVRKTRATSTSRQKKTAPRGAVRKNIKQAK